MKLESRAFNLEQALAGKAVVTRDGSVVKQLTKFEDVVGVWKLYAVVNGEVMSFKINGKQGGGPNDSPYDLFMASEKKWVNVYYINGVASSSVIGYDSEEAAIRNRRKDANDSNTKTICFEE